MWVIKQELMLAQLTVFLLAQLRVSSLRFGGFSWCFTWIVISGRKLESSWHYERS